VKKLSSFKKYGIRQWWVFSVMEGEMGKSPNGKHEYHNNNWCLVVLKEIDD